MTAADLPPIALAFYGHKKDNEPDVRHLSWAEVITLFSGHEFTDCTPCPGGKKCEKKNGMAFSPGIPREGSTRASETVEFVSMFVFDIDKVTRAELEGVCDRLKGLEVIISSTHSHEFKGPDYCCVRIILPSPRRLSPQEFFTIHQEIRRRYNLEWERPGEAKAVGWDSTTVDYSRIYFLPSAPIGSEVIEGHQEGALVDVEEILRMPPRPSVPRFVMPQVPQTLPPLPLSIQSTDLGAIRLGLLAYNKPDEKPRLITKKELARRIAVGEPLSRPEEGNIRHDCLLRAGKVVAYVAPGTTPIESIRELVRSSVMGMPSMGDDGDRGEWIDGAFEDFFESYKVGNKGKRTLEVRRAENDGARAVIMKIFSRMKSRKEAALKEDDGDETTDEEGSIPEDADWKEKYLKKNAPRKDGEFPGFKNSDGNVEAVLTHSPEWIGALSFNEVTKDILVSGGPLKEHENEPEQVTSGVKYWMQRECDLYVNTGDVMDAIRNAAKANKYNPVQEYLNGLQWDGKARIDTFLEEYGGAQTVDEDDGKVRHDTTAHVRRISRRWFLSAAARGLCPGCKVDTVLILEGEQGIKKSTMLDILGGEWFTDSPAVIPSVAASMLAGRNWIVEMPELSAMRASESEAQKAFFSSRVDQFRPPYGRTVMEFPRSCVFVGTTNDDQYMNDITGNRRYWPVKCGSIAIQKLRRDRDQLWAEAVALYKEGFSCQKCIRNEERCADHRWWLDQTENLELEKINNLRMKNEFGEAIVDHILKTEPEKRQKSYTIFEIATRVIGLTSDRVNSQQGPIGRALKTLGFARERHRENGVLSWVHKTPESLLVQPKRERNGFAKANTGAVATTQPPASA